VTDEDLFLICSKEYIEYVSNFYELANKGKINYIAVLSNNFLRENSKGLRPFGAQKNKFLL
jgi:hypothetical protein